MAMNPTTSNGSRQYRSCDSSTFGNFIFARINPLGVGLTVFNFGPGLVNKLVSSLSYFVLGVVLNKLNNTEGEVTP